jgi:GGDEF domain-containing protein
VNVLVDITERLKGCLRGSDTAARLGGDEFVMLLEDVANEGEPVGVAERFLARMRAPWISGDAGYTRTRASA